MNNTLIIRDLRVSNTSTYNEVSAEVDGDRVYFRAPVQYELASRGESFLGIALLEAMIRNVDIKIEDTMPLSEKLYRILPEIQTIYACWNSDLQKINVYAHIEPFKDNYDRVASFFSAGVDSSHTLYRNMADITHLIMITGFEAGVDTPELWRQLVEKQNVFAQNIGKKLIPIETNARQWTNQRKINWQFVHGLVLSSMGPLLKSKRIYIASSHTYNELFPWGSHPLSDPMWSTESTEVIHDSAGFRRCDKMKDLCHNQKILDNLRVCWKSTYDNCGECIKCIRTMTALYLLDATSQALPPFGNNLNKLKSFQTAQESGATFLEDTMLLAKNTGNNKVYRILLRYYLRYQIFQILKMIDLYMMGGILRRAYRWAKNIDNTEIRVDLKGSQR